MATHIGYWILAIFIIHLGPHHSGAKLQAISPSFHTLTLQATTNSQVTLCENQPWQSHVCQTKNIQDENPVLFKGKSTLHFVVHKCESRRQTRVTFQV